MYTQGKCFKLVLAAGDSVTILIILTDMGNCEQCIRILDVKIILGRKLR